LWMKRPRIGALAPPVLKRFLRGPVLPGGLPRSALRAFGIEADRVCWVSHSENAVFRVQAGASTYALRIHPPGKQDAQAIEAELAWLRALRSETSLLVPEPVSGSDGAWVQDVVSSPGRQNYQCVLFRWIDGQALGGSLCPGTMERAGAFMASLHRHAQLSALPGRLSRPRIEWKELHRWLHDDPGARVLSAQQRALCASAARILLERVAHPNSAGDIGLIHRDLHPWNYLISGQEVGAIDFDECLFAPFLCDIAVPLSYLDDRADYAVLKDRFLHGYAAIRPLPGNHEDGLDLFMAARALYIIDWILDGPHLRWSPSGLRRIERQCLALRRRLP